MATIHETIKKLERDRRLLVGEALHPECLYSMRIRAMSRAEAYNDAILMLYDCDGAPPMPPDYSLMNDAKRIAAIRDGASRRMEADIASRSAAAQQSAPPVIVRQPLLQRVRSAVGRRAPGLRKYVVLLRRGRARLRALC